MLLTIPHHKSRTSLIKAASYMTLQTTHLHTVWLFPLSYNNMWCTHVMFCLLFVFQIPLMRGMRWWKMCIRRSKNTVVKNMDWSFRWGHLLQGSKTIRFLSFMIQNHNNRASRRRCQTTFMNVTAMSVMSIMSSWVPDPPTLPFIQEI